MKGRRFLVISLAVLCVLVASVYFYLRPESIFAPVRPDRRVDSLLVRLADSALVSRDVPIAAVILYRGRVVGEGYNTVIRDGNAAGHAEINAMTDAIRRLGMGAFMRLNRDSLVLVSTYEPCPMCRAAAALYRIKKVEFLKEKPLMYRLREDLADLVYRFRERTVRNDTIQDYLFRKHPDFGKQNY